jgi:hypothetical protein
VKLDLSEIRHVLASVDRLLGGHDGEHLQPAHRRIGQLQRSDIETTALLNDLRLAQEFLQLASAEIAAAGWRIQGQDDPRRPHHEQAAVGATLNRDINSRSSTAPKTINLVSHHPAGARTVRPASMPRQGV